MPQVPKTYQYGTTDDPNKIAAQFGISPQQLINANPGGYPFSTGQTINIPQNNFLQPGFKDIQPILSSIFSPANPGRNVQGGGFTSNPYAVQNPGRNVQGGGNMSLASTPGRNVIGGWAYPTQGNQAAYGPPSKAIAEAAPKPLNYAQLAAQGMQPSTSGPWHVTSQIMQRIATNPEEFANLNPSQQESVMKAMSAAGVDVSGMTSGNEGGGGDTFDPRLYQIQYNKNAKNRSSTFQTNLKWAQNAWKRKKQQAKGKGRQNAPTYDKSTTRGAAAASQQDNSVTGFGLVNFSAASG